MDEPNVVEMWMSAPTPQNEVELYLSDAAVKAVMTGFMSIPIADTRTGSALPANCTFVLDDTYTPTWGLQEAQRHLNLLE